MAQAGDIPDFSAVIPARDEEKYLPGCLRSLEVAALRAGVKLQIIVVLNRCTDSTEEIARRHNCTIVTDDSRNLSKIRNSGVRHACADVVVTVDADSAVSQNMFERIGEEMSNSEIIGGGVLILPERWSLGIFLTIVCLAPIAICHRISAGLFFFRRSEFWEIDGFNEELSSAEDIDFARRLKKHAHKKGQRFRNLFRAHITTSMRKLDKLGDWYFLRHPLLCFRLLKGKSQTEADKIWYHFKR